MADGFEAKKGPDGRIFVVLHSDCKISREQILDLLIGMGADPALIVFVDPEEFCAIAELQDAPVIFPLDEVCCDAAELDEAARHCGQAGGSVIAVFGEGFPYKGLHPIAEKYGTQCGWSAEALKKKVAGDDSDGPIDGTGDKPSRPTAGQVNC
jgi:hypothetical protein